MSIVCKPFPVLGALAAAALCAPPLSADDATYANDVTLSAKETKTASWNAAGSWSDGLAPDASKTYSVLPAGVLFVQTSDKILPNDAWSGGRLAIAGKFRVNVGTADKWAPYIADLVLREGSEVEALCYGPFATNATSAAATSVRVEGTSASPARITQHYKDSFTTAGAARSHVLTADFTGTSSSVLEYERPFVNYADTAIDRGFYCRVASTAFANYPGTFRVTGGNTIVSAYDAAFAWPQTAFCVADGALCKFNRNDTTSESAGVSLRSLSVEGATVSYVYNATKKNAGPLVTVTEGFSIDADSTVRLTGASVALLAVGVSSANPNGSTGLTLAHLSDDAATAAPSDGTYPAVRIMLGDDGELPDATFRLLAVDAAAGGKDVVIAAPNLVTMTNVNVETTGTPAGATQYGAFETGHAGDWSNGETPAADSTRHYWATKRLCFFESVSLPSATLTFGAPKSSWKAGASIAFKEVNLLEGTQFGLWGADVVRRLTADRLNVLSPTGAVGEAKIHAGPNFRLTIDAALAGGAKAGLVLSSASGATAEKYAQIDLPQASPDFHGRLTFTTDITTGAKHITRTQLGDALSWGGTYTASSDGYDAVTLAKYARVAVTNDVAFTEPTRGILVSGGACFDVEEGKTLRLANQVTWAGELEKLGYGVLDLAGTARFVDGQSGTAPLAATNVLTLAEGALRVSSADAANGLAVSFADGTRLIVPSDSEKGYCNVLWDKPMTVGTPDGVLPVEIAIAAAHEKADSFEAPIATFSATAAASVPTTAFRVLKTSTGLRCKEVTTRTNADGSVTYVASLERRGMVVVVR